MGRSKNRKTKIVIAGDWNARVGQAQDDDDDQIVGQTNFGHRSERGTQFVKWCSLDGYRVANTFSAETDQMWTYQNGKNGHQLDYIILSRSLAARFISCHVLSDVDGGSDHRPVQVKFSISADDAAVRNQRQAIGLTGTTEIVETLIAKRFEIKDIPDLIAAEREQMYNSVSTQIHKETASAWSKVARPN